VPGVVDEPARALIFDFDGTLVDSDAALVAPFLALGVASEEISFGHAIAEECDRLGVPMERYVELYDEDAVQPFPGVAAALGRLRRWALCSNKHPRSGLAELQRLGWEPEVALFADHFGWAHKSIAPVLESMGLGPDEVVMVGDSAGDVRCAEEVGCRFVWAGWNPRVRAAGPDGTVLLEPAELLGLVG
jgi:HAD superfamily hydrolase (TIGR01549 family)